MNRSENIMLRNWLNRNTVETNKPLTGVSRESFLMLYQYRTLELNIHTYHRIDTGIAKSLAFFVLSTPDSYLSNLIIHFDITKRYLIKNKNHKAKDFSECSKNDLTEHDKQLLDMIFNVYLPTNYDQKVAFVDNNYSFILDKDHITEYKSKDFTRLLAKASQYKLRSPIAVLDYNHQHYLSDGGKLIKF